MHTQLPEPDAHALAHSEKMSALLEQRLRAAPISFADYMQMVLYEPGLGYYMAGAHKFGARGDFITAPEVSGLFGECIAAQCREILSQTGGGILELGAGSGRLAESILNTLTDIPELTYSILEPSAELQVRQQRYLAARLGQQAVARVRWLQRLPEHFVGVCVANEVMDALPVELFEMQAGQPYAVGVSAGVDGPEFCRWPAQNKLLADYVRGLQTELGESLPDGYRSEACLVLDRWIRSLADCMQHGVLLLSDYGYPRSEYYLAERRQGTLNCFYQHHVHDDPFRYPGLQDITAHVDFTAVITSADSAGMELLGYTSQSAFLRSSGLAECVENRLQQCQNEVQRLSLARDVKTLTLPGEMGERFQFMALGKQFSNGLAGFVEQDLSYRL